MKKVQLFWLLIVATGTTIIQSCQKLKRIEPPCPILDSITPIGAHFGDTVSINGTNFLPNLPELYKVKIGDSTLSPDDIIDVPNANTLRFKVPSGIQNWRITVSVVGGTVCNTTQTLNLIHYYKAKMVSQLAGGFNLEDSPAGLDLDKDGNLIVADYEHNQIKFIDPTPNIETYGKQGKHGCNEISTRMPIENVIFKHPKDI
jgi:hypothetical protein